VDKELNVLVFGESVINDAVSIVLYRACAGFIVKEMTTAAVLWAVFTFVYSFLVSLFMGIFVSLLAALTFKHGHLHNEMVECMVMFLYSYLAFELAEAPHLSGIVASLAFGLASQHYAYHNLTPDAKMLTRKLFKVGAMLSEAVIFFYVGANVFLLDTFGHPGFVIWSIVLCLAARGVNVFFCAGLCVNGVRGMQYKKQTIPMNHLLMMWHAGLRGAIAYALAVGFPSHNKDQVVAACTWVCLFTIFVLGGSTSKVLELLSIKKHDHDLHHQEEHESSLEEKLRNIPEDLRQYLPDETTKRKKLFRGLSAFDAKYIKGTFRNSLVDEEDAVSKAARALDTFDMHNNESDAAFIAHDEDGAEVLNPSFKAQ